MSIALGQSLEQFIATGEMLVNVRALFALSCYGDSCILSSLDSTELQILHNFFAFFKKETFKQEAMSHVKTFFKQVAKCCYTF